MSEKLIRQSLEYTGRKGWRNMRTGAFGQRSLDELVATLPEPKRSLFEKLRVHLKGFPLKESVDYNPYELEWNPIYTKPNGVEVLHINFKWDFSATINIPSSKTSIFDNQPNLKVLAEEQNERDEEFNHIRYPIHDEKDLMDVRDLVARLL